MQSKYTKLGHQAPVKTLQQILREIQPDEVFRPLEIVKNGWIKDTQGRPNYMYILERIREGELKAKNIGKDNQKPRYIVKGEDLISFLEEKFLK